MVQDYHVDKQRNKQTLLKTIIAVQICSTVVKITDVTNVHHQQSSTALICHSSCIHKVSCPRTVTLCPRLLPD